MRILKTLLLFALLIYTPAMAQATTVLASGGGYRSFVDELADAYTAETGNHIERIYGNMSRIVAQAKSSGTVDLLLGDASFLNKAQLPFVSTEVVGKGTLVVAYPKGSAFKDSDDLLATKVTRIAMPDPVRAIYGKAALQYLKSSGIYETVEPKLLVVATVPQAASYIIAGEVDYALINLTHARKIEKNIGGYTVVDEKSYSPISIIIGQLETPSGTDESNQFLQFLQSDKAKKIRIHHGM